MWIVFPQPSLSWHHATLIDNSVPYVVGFNMDGSIKDACEGSEFGELEDDDTDEDEPSPYVSDTEYIDLDELVESLPHHINQWKIYRVEDFELEKIGDGFFGEIYKSTERETNNVMVMKSIKRVGKMKLMCAEIRLMCRLKHPNILRFLGVCIHNANINLVIKYMDIGNLEEVVLNLSEALPWSLRMKLAHDISKGMEYLHREGVIHRDLASRNVLISNESGGYLAVVGDFGLAAKIPSRKKRLNVVGSPYWMAPEVIRHVQYNETVDIFSYGIILCEIIGRVQSSPDDIPRTNEYGLDVDKFREQVEGCPPEFLQLAVCCCQIEPESRPPFEITANFLEYIRQLSIVEGSPTKLKSEECDGNVRRSANIEDWLIDKKKIIEPSIDSPPPCNETCVCEDDTAAVANGTHENVDTTCEPPTLTDTPCKRRRSNKRNSLFSAIRYKYFRPTVVTEDLVENTPSKLASFFNRVLHLQTKHKFDRSRKTRTKPTRSDGDNADKPRLCSYRLFGDNKDLRASDDEQRLPDRAHFDEMEESARESYPSNDQDDLSRSSSTNVRFVEPLPKLALVSDISSADTGGLTRRSISSNSCCAAEERQTLCISPDPVDQVDFGNNGSLEKESALVMSWPQTSLREATNISKNDDMNGFNELHEAPLPRCQSESNVRTKKQPTSVKSCRSLSTCQQSNVMKPRKYWNFMSLFRKQGKGKSET